MLKLVGIDKKPAFAYLRQKDPELRTRQLGSILDFAARAGFEIIGEFEDGDGAGAADARPGFSALLRHIEIDGARTIIVETADCFERDPISQEVGYARLRSCGIELIATDASLARQHASPVAQLVDQVLAIADEFDKAIVTGRKRGRARRLQDKTRASHRKTYAEMAPQATYIAKRLYLSGKRGGAPMSLREIAAALAKAGHIQPNGNAYHPEAIRRMIKGRWPKMETAE